MVEAPAGSRRERRELAELPPLALLADNNSLARRLCTLVTRSIRYT